MIVSATEKAREALAKAGVLAPTDAQVSRCIALAAYYAATGTLDPFVTAAFEAVKES